jgi:hypothetical protein
MHRSFSNSIMSDLWSKRYSFEYKGCNSLLEQKLNNTVSGYRKLQRTYLELYFHFTFMDQISPREANSRSASEKLLQLLWNPEVRYRVHKSLLSPLSVYHFVIFMLWSSG